MSLNSQPFGLVLSGGGARGAYQAGVLRALVELDVQIQTIAGASIGALNGAIIAAAPSLREAVARLEKLWMTLANEPPLAPNWAGYFTLLAAAGLQLAPLGRIANTIGGATVADETPLLSSGPLHKLFDDFLDLDALASGIPLHVSLFENKSALLSLAAIALADLGIKDTGDSEFVHVQSKPREEQRAWLLGSASLPLALEAQKADGKTWRDGGIGGFQKSQGNTPVAPLLDAGISRIIVVHIGDGSPWSRHDFPKSTVVEIRPQTPIGSGIGDMLNFEPSRIQSLIEQGRADTLMAWEKVQRPLHAISKLRQSIDALATSERAYEALDAETHDAMTRIRGN